MHTMEMSFKLKNLGFSAVSSCDAQGSHGRFCATTLETDFLCTRNCFRDNLSQLEMIFGFCIGYDLEKDATRFTVTDSGVVVIPKGELTQQGNMLQSSQLE